MWASRAAGQWTCRVTALSGVVIVACFFTLQVMLLPFLLPESRYGSMYSCSFGGPLSEWTSIYDVSFCLALLDHRNTDVGMGVVTPRTEHLRHHSVKSQELDDDDLDQPPPPGDAQEVVVQSSGDDQVGT